MAASNTNTRPLELELLCSKLEADFGALISGIGDTPAKRRSNFFTQALAAFVLCEAAGASPAEAIEASIDGQHDHGIDSVWIDSNYTIWLLQSKYIDAGKGEPDLGDVSKFCDGVRDFMAQRWHRFNDRLQAKSAALEQAMAHKLCEFKVLLVHTGTAINDDRRALFADLEASYNRTAPGSLKCSAYGLTTLHDLHTAGQSTSKINANIELADFGQTDHPYRAFYGRLAASQLAQLWHTHQDALVERNIRRFKGSTSVNQGLGQTLANEAEHFFYFNNGVTFLCDAIKPVGLRDTTRSKGAFRVEGLSIINGAQTAGAIGRHDAAHFDANPAEVMATFICLDNAPDTFGEQVTQYRNRQNAVDLQDFASLDERQIHWRQLLKMAGIDYILKHGEDDLPASDTCFSISDAAPFLACTITANHWADFLIAAKSDQKKLFGRTGLVASTHALHNAYEKLFPDSLTARKIWRTVQIGRLVRQQMLGRSKTEADPGNLGAEYLQSKEILRHGMWLVLHVVFIRWPLQNGSGLQLSAAEMSELSIAVDQLAQSLVQVVQAQVWGKQAESVFKNRSDCQNIKDRLIVALGQRK